MRFDYKKWSDKIIPKGERPPFEKYYKILFVVFCSYLTADLITLYLRQYLIPTQAPAPGQMGKMVSTFVPKPSYSAIDKFNIFNSDHQIPPPLGSSTQGEFEEDNDPIPSSLPLTLVGTIVHGNPKLSVSTIQEQGRDVESYMLDEEIPGMAKIKEIVRDKVIFRNLRNRKLEYIEIKEDSNMTFGISKKGNTGPSETAKEETNFTFQKTEIQEQLNNLSAVLNDATAIPNKMPDGSLHGFRLVHIKPGSIYERLGLKRGDILLGVGGEAIDSPQRAMEMYQQLKDSNYIELDIERGDGNRMTLKYNINP